MIDAAHCGDSDLSIAENEKVIKNLAKTDALDFPCLRQDHEDVFHR